MILTDKTKMNELLMIKMRLNPEEGENEVDVMMCDCTGCDGGCSDQCDDTADNGHCDLVFCPGVV
jgi:hypothetical protein